MREHRFEARMRNDNDARSLFGNRIFDEEAYTIKELLTFSGLGQAQTATKVNEAVEAGEWEQVWKRLSNGRPVKAYRKVK